MAVTTLRPNTTLLNTGTDTGGAGSASAALADDSDATYVEYDPGELSQVGFADVSLPAGAVFKRVALRARYARTNSNPCNLAFSSNFPEMADTSPGFQSVTFLSPTTTTLAAVDSSQIADADVDSLAVVMQCTGSAVALRVYAAYFDVTYVELPVVNVTAPSGTLSDTNLPLVEWERTLDADGGSQYAFEVKVFSDAQYGAGGFDPDTSTPTDTSGVQFLSSTWWQPTTPLGADTYRAYVRVAQRVNGERHWSDWDYSAFVVDPDLPDPPTLTLTPDNANARIIIECSPEAGAVIEIGRPARRPLRALLDDAARTGLLNRAELEQYDPVLVKREAERLGLRWNPAKTVRPQTNTCLVWALKAAYDYTPIADMPQTDFLEAAGGDHRGARDLASRVWDEFAAERGLAWWRSTVVAPHGLKRWIATVPASYADPIAGHAIAMEYTSAIYDVREQAHGGPVGDISREQIVGASVLLPLDSPLWEQPVACWRVNPDAWRRAGQDPDGPDVMIRLADARGQWCSLAA